MHAFFDFNLYSRNVKKGSPFLKACGGTALAEGTSVIRYNRRRMSPRLNEVGGGYVFGDDRCIGVITVFTKKTIARVLVYLSGLCILALGLTLSTKADLGVSPIIAVSFCVSKLTGTRFGDMTFLLYASFVAIEMLLHLVPGKRCPSDRKKAVLADALQLPLSYFFTVLLNVLSARIPAADTMT